MIIFAYGDVRYQIGPYDKYNIAVGRTGLNAQELKKSGHVNWGRKTFYKDYESAFRAIASEGCREVQGESVDAVIDKFATMREAFEATISRALKPDADYGLPGGE